MICWRFGLWRKMVPYLHGRLDPQSVTAMEVHLADCSRCRKRLEGLLQTESMIRRLPGLTANPGLWPRIEQAIAAPLRPAERFRRTRAVALAAAASVAILVVGSLLGNVFRDPENHSAVHEKFQEVPLSQFSITDSPHVSTVGYVSDVRKDEQDGDLTFKLVDDIRKPQHFVICEIIPAFKLDTPHPGSRIRVSGINRFDSQAEHQWFEIHPVLSIEQVQ